MRIIKPTLVGLSLLPVLFFSPQLIARTTHVMDNEQAPPQQVYVERKIIKVPSSPQNQEIIVKQRNPVKPTPLPPEPSSGHKVVRVQPTPLPQVIPMLAGSWTCYAADSSGARWYMINKHRKEALHHAKKLCKHSSHTPHSCFDDKAFCVYAHQTNAAGQRLAVHHF